MKIITLFLMVALIVCFPFPIKISLQFKNNKFLTYIYGIKLPFSKKKTKKNLNNKSTSLDGALLKKIMYIYNLINHIFSNRKVAGTINTEIKYGVEDAFYTAVMYPTLTLFVDIIAKFFLKFLDREKSKVSIKPIYGKNLFEFSITGIIYISIGKIIRITHYILKNKIRGEKNVSSN
ncbi:hypothetical protein SAMN02745248_00565 [Hathewaya proteolytica DSM 3090]|uniref:DUF2953 domain-containing protein n=1 Tax=Hathewaya proteolytica DSM 3090 TaxID=1121331 RepID=A0A1M6KZB5_9CLOT|nr:hypothetical protein [Hathewaya proteolytica]SHJ64335.1 hypothetical protein SAMN02745248_00565 [Hathewaya proteolytica DSM 3090]